MSSQREPADETAPEREPAEEESDGEGEENQVCSLLASSNARQGRSILLQRQLSKSDKG